MRIERCGVVGLLENQTSGGARNVVDDHELTGKFYEWTKVWISGSAPPPALRDASQLYQDGKNYLIYTFINEINLT